MSSDYTFTKNSEIINTNNLNYTILYKAVKTEESFCNIGELVIVCTSGNNLIPAIVTSTDPFIVSSYNPLNLVSSGSEEEKVGIGKLFLGYEEKQILILNENILVVGLSSGWNSTPICKNTFGLSETPSTPTLFVGEDLEESDGYFNPNEGFWVSKNKFWYSNITILHENGFYISGETVKRRCILYNSLQDREIHGFMSDDIIETENEIFSKSEYYSQDINNGIVYNINTDIMTVFNMMGSVETCYYDSYKDLYTVKYNTLWVTRSEILDMGWIFNS